MGEAKPGGQEVRVGRGAMECAGKTEFPGFRFSDKATTAPCGEKTAPRGEDATRRFHGEKRTNETHESKTDPDARLYKKSRGSEAKLSYLGHVLVENRHGLIVDVMLTQADGTAEADAAILMADAMRKKRRGQRFTLGADKAYDNRDVVTMLQAMHITPHVAQNNKHRRSAIDGRTTRHRGYAISQSRRPIIERTFAWLKAVAGMRKVKLRGLEKVSWLFQYAVAAYNLWRIPRLTLAET